MLAQVRQFFIEKRLRPDILQADGIEHAGRSFPKTRRRIADHRFLRQALHHKAAQLAQMDDILEFDPVAESATGRDDRILERNACDVYAEIGGRIGGCAALMAEPSPETRVRGVPALRSERDRQRESEH